MFYFLFKTGQFFHLDIIRQHQHFAEKDTIHIIYTNSSVHVMSVQGKSFFKSCDSFYPFFIFFYLHYYVFQIIRCQSYTRLFYQQRFVEYVIFTDKKHLFLQCFGKPQSYIPILFHDQFRQ